ncbi:hypothetical protein [Herbaspirillum sp. alder98]|uniref:hypothetical protein n=1 Tax=Herbaspirillum sp. alder98 TaxID=2913096 RepID=UPI001CD872CD|nr:hypothetical protein [Herbaspirillum sp. alder98]MCA1326485.1 hypothetical protein [Herbaspirillum sp. alder98]
MKKAAILLVIGLTIITTLGACSYYEGYTTMKDGDKLHARLGDTPSKSHTLTKMGAPETRVQLPDQGECLQYQVTLGQQQPFALGFDKNGNFLEMDADTCAGAISRNVFSKAAAKAGK